MLFNSVLFFIFFGFIYTVYWILPKKPRLYFLIAGSVFFYAWWGIEVEGWWGIRWTIHFLGMVSINYLLVNRIIRNKDNNKKKKNWLYLAIFVNLLNLGLFKYYEFLRTIFLDLDLPAPPPVQIFSFLPLAISFYTFQLLAYTVDVYRGVIEKSHNFRQYFVFILFFPQLIAGPIMRSTDFMWQIDNPNINRRKMYDGIWLILGGLVKKVLIADPIGILLAPVYSSPENYNGIAIFLAGLAFSIQVYCDFSGYTDIARGVARLLGYDIPENFKAPYFARSARELWGERWHITLNTWLRDYIYIPLGGSRVSKWRAYFNLGLTFAIGGLWHGADYSFLIWGISWGLFLALERFLEVELGISTTPKKNRLLIGAKIAFMFVLFIFGALMFRAQAVEYKTVKQSSGEIVLEMFSGLVVNHTHSLKSELARSEGTEFIQYVDDVFGKEVLQLNSFGNEDTVILMLFLTGIFHVFQFKPGIFERFRKYDLWFLLIFGGILCGWILPGIAVASHQFIYFVF